MLQMQQQPDPVPPPEPPPSDADHALHDVLDDAGFEDLPEDY